MNKPFYFKNWSWNAENGQLSLKYECENYLFEEKISFPNAPFLLTAEKKDALNQIFFLLHIAAGVSYYKAFGNPEIKIESGELSKHQADFFNDFYRFGLGQFATQNNLTLSFDFPYGEIKEKAFALNLKNEAFVPVGGGKDSCVTINRLKKAGMKPTLFSVNTARPIDDCKRIANLPEITIKRKISSVLLENNNHFLNGHVPISGIIAFISAAACILYDKRYVVMSCEGSADEANFGTVNHQWSKSSAFEVSYNDLIRTVVPEIHYFSLLRPMTEMQIAREFAQNCAEYFDVFTSCNHAFHIDEKRRLDRWCGVCDKCRFVFLILAPFMDKERLIKIIGTNPLDDATQETGYLALLGIGQNKPFECVGTYDECRLAFLMLAERPEWQKDCLIQKIVPLLKDFSKDSLEKTVWAKGKSDLIPEAFKNV